MAALLPVIPACAEMTGKKPMDRTFLKAGSTLPSSRRKPGSSAFGLLGAQALDSSLRWNDEQKLMDQVFLKVGSTLAVIPAKAGIQCLRVVGCRGTGFQLDRPFGR